MRVKETIDHIVDWLKEYAEKAKTDGFVVGVSGGVDSAVTSALVAKTGFPVTCVEMPIYQDVNQVNRALKHIEHLQSEYSNVRKVRVNLTPVFDNLISSLPPAPNSDLKEMSLVNTRARLRMTTLYYFAALERKLVAGTGNKVEDFGVGFFTKYGDGGVDISPIADLLKSEVYALAKELNIISEIMEAPPTDGLWGDDRTDEDQIGASYDELEWAMKMKKEKKNSNDFEGREKEVFEIFTRYNVVNQHKMQPIPVCNIPENLKN